jgi:hypothetical protein
MTLVCFESCIKLFLCGISKVRQPPRDKRECPVASVRAISKWTRAPGAQQDPPAPGAGTRRLEKRRKERHIGTPPRWCIGGSFSLAHARQVLSFRTSVERLGCLCWRPINLTSPRLSASTPGCRPIAGLHGETTRISYLKRCLSRSPAEVGLN